MTTPNIIWLKNGRTYSQVEDTVTIINNLPNRIYNLQEKPNGELYLEEYTNQFAFDFKIYDLEEKFINHVINTYHNTTGNLGILLNGLKGTGKTVTAKLIAQRIGLPVVMVGNSYDGLQEFIAKIPCPCTFFFDEFEKVFHKEDNRILGIMDGVYNSTQRKVFLLTTNNLYINENLLGRPSRIRYKKSFGNLSPEAVKAYLDDNLIDKSRTQEIVEFVDGLSFSTIDILKCITEEVNINKTSLQSFKHFINVEQAKYNYKFYLKWKPNGKFDYSLEDFKNDLKRIGTKEKNEDGELEEITMYDLDVSFTSCSSNRSVEYLSIGDFFWNGNVSQELDDEGFIIIERDEDTAFIKIENLDNKPSLYRGRLVY